MNPSADPSVQQAIRRLGIEISEMRRRQRLSQSALAQKAGLSLSTVRRLERGESGVAIHALLIGFKALGMLDEFTTLMGSNPKGARKDDQCERLPKRLRQPTAKVAKVEVKRQEPAEVGSQSPASRCGANVAEPPEGTPQQPVGFAGGPWQHKKVKAAVRMNQPTNFWAQDDLFSPS